ncbi:metallo-beta-lactamase superfamily domain-containing protein [Ditylenchus destructor]|uniref:Metallo-beta-lactamase domain-containing protein 1 n=1 Tax=Ditylenchus destructor TaxID=166010 RepID=A0AAD4MQH5_9BILA|nr:metallo-beta-lactamase superfamily domain-containing protein [Ditylenchus destructor]
MSLERVLDDGKVYDISVKQHIVGTVDFDKSMKDENGTEYVSASCSVTLIETNPDNRENKDSKGLKILVDCAGPLDEKKLFGVLEKNGVSVEQITHLVITHWHTDHCGNLRLFPNAQLLCPDSPDIPRFPWKICEGVILKKFPHAHSTCDLVVEVDQVEAVPVKVEVDQESSSMKSPSRRLVVIAGDIFEREGDWKTDEMWKVASSSPARQTLFRLLCWRKADVIVPGHGPAFLSPGYSIPREGNTLPRFAVSRSKATVKEVFNFLGGENCIYRIYLVVSNEAKILVNCGGPGTTEPLKTALHENGISNPSEVTHLVMTNIGQNFNHNMSLFSNAKIFMHNDICTNGSFFAKFEPPAVSITPDVFVWKNIDMPEDGSRLSVAINDSGGRCKVISGDGNDKFILHYLDVSSKDVDRIIRLPAVIKFPIQ